MELNIVIKSHIMARLPQGPLANAVAHAVQLVRGKGCHRAADDGVSPLHGTFQLQMVLKHCWAP